MTAGEQTNFSGEIPERRILIAADDRDFAESLADILQLHGFFPAVTTSEREALARLKEFQAQVALLDISLGQGNGIALIDKIRDARPAALCIMMTAYVAIDSAIDAIRHGAYDYLQKPINVDDLLTTLARCFDKIRLENDKAEAKRALRATNRELNEINARLRNMVESTRGLATCSYINELGPLLLEEFAQNMAAKGGSIYLRDADNLKRVHALDPGHSPDTIPFPPKIGSILGMATDSGQPVLIQDIRSEEGIASSGWSGYEDDSLLVFLLQDEKEEILGFITLHNKQPPPFTIQDLELGTLLSSFSCERLRATQAIAALRQSEAEYRKLFNNLPDVFYRTDLEGRILMASPAIGNLLGSSVEEIIGTNSRDYYLYPQKRDELLELLSEKASVEGFEFQLKRKDATIIWVSVNAHYFRDKVNNIIGVEGIIRDVTERKNSEEAHRRLATAVEQAAELILITDTDGTIQYVNPSFERVTEYTREELIGKNSRILKSGKHDQAFYKDLWDTIQSGDVWRGRIINKTKSGRLYQEEATITPIRDSAGNIINYVGVKRDVTRESMLEKQLQQAQKMEAIGTLAGGIAHDFNNILAAISGYSELARLDMKNNPRAINNLDKVLQASYRAKELVTQILTFSRRAEYENKPVHISSIVKEALKLMRASLPTTIDIQQHIDQDIGNVLADPTQIHQVLMNICTNAGHAMRDTGGILQVTLSRPQGDSEFTLQFPGQDPENYLRLKISDTGHGMPPELLERIFDPYFTTKEKGEGTGLGLAVVHGIVKNHNGHISVSSEVGKGSTFCVYLPRLARGSKPWQKDAAQKIPRGSEHILLVDDEKDIVQMEKQMLERLGYLVTTRTDSAEALQDFQLQPNKFDLVITDMTMPKMTGDLLAQEIRKIDPAIPIILCTGFSAKVSAEIAHSIGISEYLLKPLALDKLARMVRELLDDRIEEEKSRQA